MPYGVGSKVERDFEQLSVETNPLCFCTDRNIAKGVSFFKKGLFYTLTIRSGETDLNEIEKREEESCDEIGMDIINHIGLSDWELRF